MVFQVCRGCLAKCPKCHTAEFRNRLCCGGCGTIVRCSEETEASHRARRDHGMNGAQASCPGTANLRTCDAAATIPESYNQRWRRPSRPTQMRNVESGKAFNASCSRIDGVAP